MITVERNILGIRSRAESSAYISNQNTNVTTPASPAMERD
jgi:hypothetical protein